jgi:hypothetical protein
MKVTETQSNDTIIEHSRVKQPLKQSNETVIEKLLNETVIEILLNEAVIETVK